MGGVGCGLPHGLIVRTSCWGGKWCGEPHPTVRHDACSKKGIKMDEKIQYFDRLYCMNKKIGFRIVSFIFKKIYFVLNIRIAKAVFFIIANIFLFVVLAMPLRSMNATENCEYLISLFPPEPALACEATVKLDSKQISVQCNSENFDIKKFENSSLELSIGDDLYNSINCEIVDRKERFSELLQATSSFKKICENKSCPNEIMENFGNFDKGVAKFEAYFVRNFGKLGLASKDIGSNFLFFKGDTFDAVYWNADVFGLLGGIHLQRIGVLFFDRKK